MAGEVDVFDPKTSAFEEAEASAVQKGRHESGHAFHVAEDGAHLVAAPKRVASAATRARPLLWCPRTLEGQHW